MRDEIDEQSTCSTWCAPTYASWSGVLRWEDFVQFGAGAERRFFFLRRTLDESQRRAAVIKIEDFVSTSSDYSRKTETL
jgi:hypothetical protein